MLYCIRIFAQIPHTVAGGVVTASYWTSVTALGCITALEGLLCQGWTSLHINIGRLPGQSKPSLPLHIDFTSQPLRVEELGKGKVQ